MKGMANERKLNVKKVVAILTTIKQYNGVDEC